MREIVTPTRAYGMIEVRLLHPDGWVFQGLDVTEQQARLIARARAAEFLETWERVKGSER